MLRWLWLSALVVVLDQASKQVIMASMSLYDSMPVVPFLRMTYVHNTGAAFSFLSDAGGWQRWLFARLAIFIGSIIGVWLGRLERRQKLLAVSLALILGGAVGNLIDRLVYGFVIDFIDVYYRSWHWPAFNIADTAISIGVALMLLDSLLDGRREEQQAGKEQRP